MYLFLSTSALRRQYIPHSSSKKKIIEYCVTLPKKKQEFVFTVNTTNNVMTNEMVQNENLYGNVIKKAWLQKYYEK